MYRDTVPSKTDSFLGGLDTLSDQATPTKNPSSTSEELWGGTVISHIRIPTDSSLNIEMKTDKVLQESLLSVGR